MEHSKKTLIESSKVGFEQRHKPTQEKMEDSKAKTKKKKKKKKQLNLQTVLVPHEAAHCEPSHVDVYCLPSGL